MAGYQEDERFLDAIADAEPYPYWMEDVDEPDSNPMLVRDDVLGADRRTQLRQQLYFTTIQSSTAVDCR
jgi:hypothetical protein